MHTIMDDILSQLDELRERVEGSYLRPEEVVLLAKNLIRQMERGFEEDARLEVQARRGREQAKEDI